MSLSPNSLSLPALQCTVSPLSSPSTVFTAFTAAFYTVEPRSYQHRDKSLQCHLILSNFLLPVLPALRFWGIFSFCDAFVLMLFTLGIAWEPKHFALGTCGAGAVPGKGERSAGKGRMKASSCGRVSPWSRSCRNWGGICRWNALELQRDNLPEFSSTHTLRNFKPIEIGRYFAPRETGFLKDM